MAINANPHEHTRLATFVERRILELSARKSQGEIAVEAGFMNVNMLSMIKSGKSKLALDRVPALAKALDTDPRHLFLLAFEQAGLKTILAAVNEVFGTIVSRNEVAWLEEIREASGRADPSLTSRMRTSIDRFVDLSDIRQYLAEFYSHTGRPSIDPELLIRMLLVGYCSGIRSERRLCEEVHLNLAYRWFCRLDLSDPVPNHSTFSKNRHGRFRESKLLRHLFEKTVARCIADGLVSGQRLAADASLIEADANKQNSTPKEDWDRSAIDPSDAPRAVKEYLDVLDDAAFGAASEVEPKFTSHSDPSSQWTAARKGPAFFAYSTNYLIDTDHSVIVDVEGTRSIRQAEVGSVRTMLDRIKDRHDIDPERLIADTAYGTGPMLGWLVKRGIAPHIPVIDQAQKAEGVWSRDDFEWDQENDRYICPEGHDLKQFRRNYSDPNRGPSGKGTMRYRALKLTCQDCPSKAKCCPDQSTRTINREPDEDARQVARDIAETKQYKISMRLRKKVEMLFAHLKRILGLGRLRLRGPCGANDEFLLAATAQNLRKLAKIFPAPQQTRKA